MNKTNIIKLKAIISFSLYANAASSSTPVGPLLGQYGIPVMPFCNEFNKRTSSYQKEVQLFTIIKLYTNDSYVFTIKEPSLSFLLKRASLLKKKKTKELEDLNIIDTVIDEGKDNISEFKALTVYQMYEIVIYKKKNELHSFLDDKKLCLKSLGVMKSAGIYKIINY